MGRLFLACAKCHTMRVQTCTVVRNRHERVSACAVTRNVSSSIILSAMIVRKQNLWHQIVQNHEKGGQNVYIWPWYWYWRSAFLDIIVYCNWSTTTSTSDVQGALSDGCRLVPASITLITSMLCDLATSHDQLSPDSHFRPCAISVFLFFQRICRS